MAFIIPPGGIQNVTPQFFNIPEEEASDRPIKTTYLGTEVYSNLIFNADPDTPENRDFVMDTVLMSITQNKLIKYTDVQGRQGRVKEHISLGDYQIDIRGSIVSEVPLVFPREALEALRNLCELPKQLAVSSSFLQIFSVSSIVVQRYRINEKKGSRNEVPFQITAYSDTPIELEANNFTFNGFG